jgi:glutamate synthase domain-containing protein 3
MSVVVDANKRDLRSISSELKKVVQDGPVTIRRASHLHGLIAGYSSADITIEGDSGDYLGVLNDGAIIKVEGNAGRYLGDNMTGGELIVNGDGGYGVGQYCYGGTVVIRGSAGDFTAVMNKGATIIIEGDVGAEAGTYMLAGDVVILGDAGRNLGNYLILGNIYIRGTWESLGHNTLEEEMTEADKDKLRGYFDRYQIEADPEEFKKIVRLSAKPFYKSKEPSGNKIEVAGFPCSIDSQQER